MNSSLRTPYWAPAAVVLPGRDEEQLWLASLTGRSQ
jgi:hypothetical protein